MASRKPPAPRPPKQLNFQLDADLWLRLDAAGRVLRKTKARLVAEALRQYFAALSAEDRQLIDRLMLPRQNP